MTCEQQLCADQGSTLVSPPKGSSQIDDPVDRLRAFLSVRSRIILVITITGFVLGVAADFLLPTRYTATATIELRQDPSGEFHVQAPSNSAGEVDSTRLDTEIHILRSHSLALAVIRTLRLERTSDLAKCPHALPWDLSLPQDRESLIRHFLDHVEVSRVGRTHLIEVRATVDQPKLADVLANTLIESYIAQTARASSLDYWAAGKWNAEQMKDLERRVRLSKERMMALQQRIVVMKGGQGIEVVNNGVGELERKLIDAEADRVMKEARLKAIKSGSPQVLDLLAGSNSLLENNQRSLQQLRSEYASLGQTYGPAYPRMSEIHAQIKEMEAGVNTQEAAQVERAKKELEQSEARVQSLRSSLQDLEGRAVAQNALSFQYELVRSEFEADHSLLQGLLERQEENRIVSTLRAGAIRVIDRAEEPSQPSHPRKLLNLALGLSLGFCAGVIVAFAQEVFAQDLSRDSAAMDLRKPPQRKAAPSCQQMNA